MNFVKFALLWLPVLIFSSKISSAIHRRAVEDNTDKWMVDGLVGLNTTKLTANDTASSSSSSNDVHLPGEVKVVGGDPGLDAAIMADAVDATLEALQLRKPNITAFDIARHIAEVINEKHGYYWAASVGDEIRLSTYFWYSEKNWVQLTNGIYRIDIWKQGC